MGWSEKYKKSIDCSNPKGFSQKAHCAGKKNEDMVFEEITEDVLNEKLITYGNRKPYGQVVFIAGGAGSGKGFAIENFLDSSSFKVRDVDEMKKQLQILNRLGKVTIKDILAKYGKNIKVKDLELIQKVQDDGYTLQNLNLKNPDHVYVLHILVKAMGIKEKSLENLLVGKNNPEVLPNIMFDITAKDVTDITGVVPMLKQAGYKAENIHLTWILTNYVTAMVNNKNRARMVPEDILLKTHEGASNTVWGLVTKALPKGMNGRVDVILNNPEHTVFYTDAEGRTINGKVKGFLALPLKKAGGGIFAEKLWKDKLFNWVKDNAPQSITGNMKESVTESNLKGYLVADVVDDIIKSIGTRFVSGEIKQSVNTNKIYLKLTDAKFGNSVVKLLKSKFGIEAKEEIFGGKGTFGSIPSVSFWKDNVISESVNEEKVYIDYLNKKKGFKQDRIKFNSYEDAVKWAKKNFEKFNSDMIKFESVNEESSEETLRGLKEMAMGDLERIADYADMILDRMNEGQELESWMYSQITLSVDQLNSVHDAMDGNDGVVEQTIEERINLFVEENEPTNPELWDKAIAAAKRKYDVYPSAYANAFASKWYKEKGGSWRKEKKD
jgi:hypothetical protein